MFGDKFIMGTFSCTIDGKSRIYISPKTGREPGEEIVVCKSQDNEYLIIYSEKTLSEKLHALTKKIDNATSVEQHREYQKLLLEVLSSIIQRTKVDKEGRINLGTDLGYQNTKIEYIGAGDSVIIKLPQK